MQARVSVTITPQPSPQAWPSLLLPRGTLTPGCLADCTLLPQACPVGEFAARLQLLHSFQAQLAAMAAAAPAQHAEQAAWWGSLSALLYNVHRYYWQFQPHVERQVQQDLKQLEKELQVGRNRTEHTLLVNASSRMGLCPTACLVRLLEHKEDFAYPLPLQDFVSLAKWEDRGYYAQRIATEKAQRQLHRLSRRALQALKEPSGAGEWCCVWGGEEGGPCLGAVANESIVDCVLHL